MNIFKKALWWVRYRTTDRYHIINISGMDGYNKGWIDRDHAMYLACFKLLVDFVELEHDTLKDRDMSLADYTNEDYQPKDDELQALNEQITRENEIRALYLWWTVQRPIEKQRHSDDTSYKPDNDVDVFDMRSKFYESDRWKSWCAEAERLDAKDEEMFDRLMKVRRALWT
jgi:hypothetical protein